MTGTTDQARKERSLFIQGLFQQQYGRKADTPSPLPASYSSGLVRVQCLTLQAIAINRLGRDSNDYFYHVKISERPGGASELLPTQPPGTVALPGEE